jgi:hypothetical protein
MIVLKSLLSVVYDFTKLNINWNFKTELFKNSFFCSENLKNGTGFDQMFELCSTILTLTKKYGK